FWRLLQQRMDPAQKTMHLGRARQQVMCGGRRRAVADLDGDGVAAESCEGVLIGGVVAQVHHQRVRAAEMFLDPGNRGAFVPAYAWSHFIDLGAEGDMKPIAYGFDGAEDGLPLLLDLD